MLLHGLENFVSGLWLDFACETVLPALLETSSDQHSARCSSSSAFCEQDVSDNYSQFEGWPQSESNVHTTSWPSCWPSFFLRSSASWAAELTRVCRMHHQKEQLRRAPSKSCVTEDMALSRSLSRSLSRARSLSLSRSRSLSFALSLFPVSLSLS